VLVDLQLAWHALLSTNNLVAQREESLALVCVACLAYLDHVGARA